MQEQVQINYKIDNLVITTEYMLTPKEAVLALVSFCSYN